jgi:DNA-3-methyladenine glycosylase II
MALHTASGTLAAVPPFDFAQSLAFLGIFPLNRREQKVADGVLHRATQFEGQVIVFRVKATGGLEQPALDYTLFSDQPITLETRNTAADRIGLFLSLDDDLKAFYDIGQRDPPFAPVIERLYGYHQVKFLTPFENAVWAILSQRNQMTLSEKMKSAITERYGRKLEINGVVYQSFPEPAQLAGANTDELASLIRHGPKAQGIIGAAHAFVHMDERFLRKADDEDVYAWLRKIKGIGEWSASFIMLRSLGRTNYLPRGERRVLDAATRVYGRMLTQEDFERLAEPYGTWRGYWAHYLRVGG